MKRGVETHLAVAVVQAQYELLEDPAGLHFSQLAVGVGTQSIGKQVPALSKLHADGKILSGEENLQQRT